MARDRKRAKQRRSRGAGAAVGRPGSAGSAANGASHDAQASAPSESQSADLNAPGPLERIDLPGALDHASADVDEFDAALVRGAGGVPAVPESQQADNSDFDVETEDVLQEPQGPGGGGSGRRGRGSGGSGDGGEVARPSGAPLRGGNRAIGFLRASWAELQRVQWPDRRQVTQATAVVLGFVAIAGLYLGAADYVAKEIVEFIL